MLFGVCLWHTSALIHFVRFGKRCTYAKLVIVGRLVSFEPQRNWISNTLIVLSVQSESYDFDKDISIYWAGGDWTELPGLIHVNLSVKRFCFCFISDGSKSWILFLSLNLDVWLINWVYDLMFDCLPVIKNLLWHTHTRFILYMLKPIFCWSTPMYLCVFHVSRYMCIWFDLHFIEGPLNHCQMN